MAHKICKKAIKQPAINLVTLVNWYCQTHRHWLNKAKTSTHIMHISVHSKSFLIWWSVTVIPGICALKGMSPLGRDAAVPSCQQQDRSFLQPDLSAGLRPKNIYLLEKKQQKKQLFWRLIVLLAGKFANEMLHEQQQQVLLYYSRVRSK